MRYLLTLFICFCANMAIAQAVPYSLDTARSTVGFTFNFTGTATQGTMPVSTANIPVASMSPSTPVRPKQALCLRPKP